MGIQSEEWVDSAGIANPNVVVVVLASFFVFVLRPSASAHINSLEGVVAHDNGGGGHGMGQMN